MQNPPNLKKGDKVAIISTARKISKEEIKPAVEVFHTWGLEVVLGDNLFEEDNQFAGTTEQRTQGLQKALDNNSIKAIFCARGGYGTVQIIDEIDFTKFQQFPKWIVGYSDVIPI